MAFNDQRKQFSERAAGSFLFKEKVPYRHMRDDEMEFRILPAYDPNDKSDTGWLPFVTDEEGTLSDFGLFLQTAAVGHGAFGTPMRGEIISLKTFGEVEFDPLTELHKYIAANRDEWGYLTARPPKSDDPKARIADVPLDRISERLVANVIDINKASKGVFLGVFTVGTTITLIGRSGLLFKKSASESPDYLQRYIWGDVTDPKTGPVLILERDKASKKGKMAPFVVDIVTDRATNKIKRFPLDKGDLESRFDLSAPESFLLKPEPQQIITRIAGLLNGRSPTHEHEYALLRAVFGEAGFEVPPVPANSYAARAPSYPGAGGRRAQPARDDREEPPLRRPVEEEHAAGEPGPEEEPPRRDEVPEASTGGRRRGPVRQDTADQETPPLRRRDESDTAEESPEAASAAAAGASFDKTAFLRRIRPTSGK